MIAYFLNSATANLKSRHASRLLILWLLLISCGRLNAETPPNIVFIFSDDQGYGDLGCYGSDSIKTPNIDSLARDGMKFESFYVCNRCSPSRAAFLTGSLPGRVGIDKVVYRRDRIGLNQDELTIAELLQRRNYATGLIGKWHLGDWPQFNPVHHGFDTFYGFLEHEERKFGIYENLELKETNVSKTSGVHSPRLLSKAIDFIRSNHQKPFFLYYASPLPHTKWDPLERFKGTSAQGTYGDVVQELDWQVGELLKELKRLELSESTLVVFASDNGPQLNIDGHGSAGVLRDGKWSNFEGGIRVPCLMRWPGKIAAGSVCQQMTAITDMLPTFCKLANAEVPTDRVIDGRSILPYMLGQEPDLPIHNTWIVPGNTIRQGDWKLFVRKGKAGGNNKHKGASKRQPVAAGTLFNLKDDLGETTNAAARHPAVVRQLSDAMSDFMKAYQANPRPSGKVLPDE